MSDSQCPTCCQSEVILKDLQELFRLDKFLVKGKRIPVARMDISKGNLLEKDMISFESVPKILIYKYDFIENFVGTNARTGST